MLRVAARAAMFAWALSIPLADAALAAPSGRLAAPRTRAQADSLVSLKPSLARDKALADWARRASTTDVMWLLRRTPRELSAAELPLLDAALSSLRGPRESLRKRLLARRSLAAPRMVKRGESLIEDVSGLRPYASVFRVATLLPDRGEYASYSRSVRAALAAGLAWGRAAGAPPIALDSLGTGDSDPALVAEALEAAAGRCDVVVGELLSGPTLSLATAARLIGLTLVSPTATDERIGRVSPGVFQVGPGADLRARALADVVLSREAHTVAIAGSASGVRASFATAFAREVESRGGKVVRRDATAAATGDLGRLARSIEASGADVLLWDGPTRDTEALIRALAAEGMTLRVCGGPALAPDAVRASARPLFEGVAYVEDDWRLPADVRARLDSLAAAAGVRAGSLWTRGFLAGRRIAAAIDAGALTSSEVAERLRSPDAALAAAGYLDFGRDGVTLPVYVVRGGKPVDAGRSRP